MRYSPVALHCSHPSGRFFLLSADWVLSFWLGFGIDLYRGGRRIGLNDENVMPVSALANRYEVIPLMDQCEGYMKVSRQLPVVTDIARLL